MTVKNSEYWDDVEGISREIIRISTEIQGPIIDDFIDPDELMNMDVEELTHAIADHYSEEDLQAWVDLEETTRELCVKHEIELSDLSMDVWTIMDSLSHQAPNSVVTHH